MVHFSPSPLVLHQLTCQFANGETLFGPLNLSFDRRHCALVSRNGVGKSRLLRLLANDDAPSAGHVETHGTIVSVAQHNHNPIDVTLATWLGYDPIVDALARVQRGEMQVGDVELLEGNWDRLARLNSAFVAAGLPILDLQRSVDTLSGGERMCAALCAAFISDADFLLLDEPSNHLDAQGRKWLYQQLDAWRGGLLVASHDRQLLMRMQRVVEMTSGGLRSYSGNYQDYCQQREREQQAAHNALKHATRERKSARARLIKEHDISQRRSAKTLRGVDERNIASFERVAYKSAAKERIGTFRKQHQEQKQSHDRAVYQARQQVEDNPPILFTLPESTVSTGKQVLMLDQVQLPFVELPPLNWRLVGPARVAIGGPNGCGKSTLLKVIIGQLAPLAGRCQLSVSVAYLDQNLDRYDLSRSVMDYLMLEDSPLTAGELRTRLAQLQLGADRLHLPLGMLSGGERLKAALACALWRREPAQLLVLDEPTNHVDLVSLQAIEAALKAYSGALLVVSHDEAFLQALGLTHRLLCGESGWQCLML